MSDEESYVQVIDEKELEEGKMKLVRVDGTPVLFIKKNSKIYVIDNRCPHMGVGLSGGILDDTFVVCPSHEWRFSLETGEYEHDRSRLFNLLKDFTKSSIVLHITILKYFS